FFAKSWGVRGNAPIGYRLPRSSTSTLPGHRLLSRHALIPPPNPVPMTTASSLSGMRQRPLSPLQRARLAVVVQIRAQDVAGAVESESRVRGWKHHERRQPACRDGVDERLQLCLRDVGWPGDDLRRKLHEVDPRSGVEIDGAVLEADLFRQVRVTVGDDLKPA